MTAGLTISRSEIDRFCLILIALAVLLVAAFVVDRLTGAPDLRLLNIDGEKTTGPWFSSVQLALIAVAFLLKAGRCRPQIDPAPWFFLLASASFFFVSLDEAAAIHEAISWRLREADWVFQFKGGKGGFITVYGTVMLLLLVVTWQQLARLWRYNRATFLLMAAGAITFLLGAVGLEIVAYELVEPRTVLHTAQIATEELLEMVGTTVILYGSLRVLTDSQAPSPAEAMAGSGSPEFSSVE